MLIEPICDHCEAISTLALWYEAEWQPYYGVDGPGDARADLEARCNRYQIPIGLVAVEDDRILGTVALDLDVTTNLTPSVVGLLVGRDYRRRGIATSLLGAAESCARQLGYSQLCMSTSVLGDMLQRTGWKVLGEVRFLNAEQGTVLVRDLSKTQ